MDGPEIYYPNVTAIYCETNNQDTREKLMSVLADPVLRTARGYFGCQQDDPGVYNPLVVRVNVEEIVLNPAWIQSFAEYCQRSLGRDGNGRITRITWKNKEIWPNGGGAA